MNIPIKNRQSRRVLRKVSRFRDTAPPESGRSLARVEPASRHVFDSLFEIPNLRKPTRTPTTWFTAANTASLPSPCSSQYPLGKSLQPELPPCPHRNLETSKPPQQDHRKLILIIETHCGKARSYMFEPKKNVEPTFGGVELVPVAWIVCIDDVRHKKTSWLIETRSKPLNPGRGAGFGTGGTDGKYTTSAHPAGGRRPGNGKGKAGGNTDGRAQRCLFSCSQASAWGRFTSGETCKRYLGAVRVGVPRSAFLSTDVFYPGINGYGLQIRSPPSHVLAELT